MSVILSFVFDNARQALPVVVLVHAMYDTISIGVAPLAETGVPLVAFSLSAALTGLVALAIVAANGPSLRATDRPAMAPAGARG